MSDKVKVTFQLSRADVEALHGFSAADGVTATETLRRIIRTEGYFRKEVQAGNKLLIGDAHGRNIKELVRV